MKRYFLFAGENYYPSGGFGDFRKDADNIEELKEVFFNEFKWCDWCHILDTQTGLIVDTFPK